jgi:hypothetical protein
VSASAPCVKCDPFAFPFDLRVFDVRKMPLRIASTESLMRACMRNAPYRVRRNRPDRSCVRHEEGFVRAAAGRSSTFRPRHLLEVSR